MSAAAGQLGAVGALFLAYAASVSTPGLVLMLSSLAGFAAMIFAHLFLPDVRTIIDGKWTAYELEQLE